MDIGALINTLIDAILFLPTWVVEKWGVFGFFLMPVILAVELLPVVLPLWFLLRKGASEETVWTEEECREDYGLDADEDDLLLDPTKGNLLLDPTYSHFPGNAFHPHYDD